MPARFPRPLVVLDAPSNLGLRPPAPGRAPGVRGMAAALRAAGLVERLRAEDAGGVLPPPYGPELDPATRVRNAAAVRDYAVALADRLDALLDAGRFPLVVGGDCSILLGSTLALRRRGRYGLVFIDGHTDFLRPETSRTGGAAGMDLALATGRGPALLTDIEGRRPYVRDEDVVVCGHRDVGDPATYAAREIFATAIGLYPPARLRRLGVGQAVEAGAATLRANGIDGYWLHLDVDALDSEVMPAVDSPQPGGLTYGELIELLGTALASDLALGFQVTIFDPDLDPGGHHARRLAAALREAFVRAGRVP